MASPRVIILFTFQKGILYNIRKLPLKIIFYMSYEFMTRFKVPFEMAKKQKKMFLRS